MALLQVALNGSRRREEHPAVPTSSPELADAAAQAVAAGAGAIHVHVRDRQGAESVAAEDVARAVTALRAAAPGTPVGVSTGAWIMRDAARRQETVAGWSVWPDYTSVNFDEAGAEALATLVLSRGSGVEVGLPHAAAAQRLADAGLAARCLRVLIEPREQDLHAALATVGRIEAVLDRAAIGLPRLLHGLDRTAWPFITESARRGYDTRIGLEDTLTLPDGSMAASNAVLVTEARRALLVRG
jgi:uncharacterized protein (DUF849 family)